MQMHHRKNVDLFTFNSVDQPPWVSVQPNKADVAHDLTVQFRLLAGSVTCCAEFRNELFSSREGTFRIPLNRFEELALRFIVQTN